MEPLAIGALLGASYLGGKFFAPQANHGYGQSTKGITSGHVFIPPYMRRRLRLAFIKTVDIAADTPVTHHFRSDVVAADRSETTTTTLPLGFNELSRHYLQYVVLGSKLSVVIYNSTTTATNVFARIRSTTLYEDPPTPSVSQYTTPINVVAAWQESEPGPQFVLTKLAADQVRGVDRLTSTYSCKRAYPGWRIDEDKTLHGHHRGGTIPAVYTVNPSRNTNAIASSNLLHHHNHQWRVEWASLPAQNPGPITVTYFIEYYCVFFDVKPLTGFVEPTVDTSTMDPLEADTVVDDSANIEAPDFSSYTDNDPAATP